MQPRKRQRHQPVRMILGNFKSKLNMLVAHLLQCYSICFQHCQHKTTVDCLDETDPPRQPCIVTDLDTGELSSLTGDGGAALLSDTR